MDYMELVKKSLSNGWKYKFLWLFGFFVAAADGFNNMWLWKDRFEGRDIDIDMGEFGDISFDPKLLILFFLAAFAVGVIIWILSVLSEGSLIHGISRKEMNLPVDFAQCWSVGLDKFFRLLGIILLATIVSVAVIVSLVLFIIPAFFLSTGLGILLILMALPVILVVILVTICVEGWAIRFAVLHNDRWLDAIARGWSLFTANVGKTLAVAFSSFLTQFVIWCGLVIALVIAAIPFIIIGYQDLWTGLVPGLTMLGVVIILSEAFFGTFASSIWTLGFMRLTGYGVSQQAPAPPPVQPMP